MRRASRRMAPSLMRYVEKQIFLQALDHLWREHLVTLDHLRQVIGWRGLAQRDPLNEYKSEAFELFGELITQLRETTTAQLNHVEIAYERAAAAGAELRFADAAGEFHGGTDASAPPRLPPAGASARRAAAAGAAKCGAGAAGADRSFDLGQGRPQRALPVRLGQEIQALPRPDRLANKPRMTQTLILRRPKAVSKD